MNICVVGAGYVGLVTGAVFADLGNEVVVVDNVPDRVLMLQAGHLPIYEPGLEEMVARNVSDGRLSFTTDLPGTVRRSVIVFIAVGTPPKTDGQTDLSAVEAVAQEIGRAMERYIVIVNKSTAPVGTGELVREIIERHQRQPIPFDVVSNPEFLREGSAIEDTLRPDRIVIGAPTQQVAMSLLELYAPLERPMLITDVASAEMIKYASNAFLATKISFMNAVANICDAAGADVIQVMKGMGYDQRVGSAFLQPGLGYGGSCFPKDALALIHTADKFGYDFKLLKSVVQVNHDQRARMMARMEIALGGFSGKTIGVLGLAFKPNTDDMREAKSVEIIRQLIDAGASVQAYDPIAMEKAREIFPNISYGKNAYDTARDADGIIVVTEWNEFKLLNLERLKESMKGNVLLDGRNIYDPVRMRRL